MINFKTNALREEFINLDPRVKKISIAMDAILNALHGVSATVTSVYREDIHSPHHFYRAVDIRSRDVKPEDCVFLELILNILFPYGKGAYCTALYHDVGQGAHFHIQVKP